MVDSVIWNNGNNEPLPCQIRINSYSPQTPVCRVSYCNVQGGQIAICVDQGVLEWGLGNTDADPGFVDSGHWEADPNALPQPNSKRPERRLIWIDGDYHLKSQAGRWDPASKDWIKDDVTSPCIDAGDPNIPVGEEPFPNGGRINMGAYGGTAQASKSYFGEPVCRTVVAGDINGDCIVDLKDLAILAQHWLVNTGKDSSKQ